MHMSLKVEFDLQKIFSAVAVTQAENKKILDFHFQGGV